jgi:small subunit ribosomal protein S6
MRHYEVTFIVDPVLSGDEVKATAQKYVDAIVEAGGTIVHIEESGLRPLAYMINKRHSGFYYCIEWTAEDGTNNVKMELTLRRDERILRFLTVTLDKFGVKYNADKRAGKIGKAKPTKKQAAEDAAEAAEKEAQSVAASKASPAAATPVTAD